MLPTLGVVIVGGTMASPSQYTAGVKVTEGATGMALTVRVIEVAGPAQLLPLVSVTNTVVVFAVELLNPNKTFVGLVPVVSTVVKPISLYHV